MKMKRIPALLLCGAVCVSAVTGCSGNKGESQATPDSAVSKTEPVIISAIFFSLLITVFGPNL